jgi:hypothetical protein
MSDPIVLPVPGVTRDWGTILNTALQEVVRRVSAAQGLTDAQMAAILADPSANATRALVAAIDAAVDGEVSARQVDSGRRFAARLLARQRDATLGFAGDSLGNETTEYAYLTTLWLATKFPNTRIVVYRDATEAGTYNTVETIQNGYPTADRPPRFVEDRFTYTAADIIGATPSEAGSAWGSNGSDAALDWTVDGAGAVATSNLPNGAILHPTVSNNDRLIEATLVPNATTPTGDVSMTFYPRFINLSNAVRVRITRHAGGATFTARLDKIIGGVQTTISEFTSDVPANGTYRIEARAGNYTYAAVNGRRLEGAQLTAADLTALSKSTGGANVGFQKGGTSNAGDRLTRFWAGDPGTARQQTLTVYIGCRASQTFQYQKDRLATLYPTPLDLLMACSSHNYGGITSATYLTRVGEFVDALFQAQPETGLVFASQNPERSPIAVSVLTAHRNRNVALAEWAERRGFGYIPVHEAFMAHESQWDDLIDPDGVHPTKGAIGTGQALMRDQYTAYLAPLLGIAG